jgi:hypothetical protein
MGWDRKILQRGVDRKTTEDMNCARNVLCDGIFEYPDNYGEDCKVPPMVDEDTAGNVVDLPGCGTNTISGDPDPRCHAARKMGLVEKRIFTDVTKTHKYRYIGCGLDLHQKALNTWAGSEPGQTVETCISKCSKRGFNYAGLEYGAECFCGNVLAPESGPNPKMMGKCTMKCSGDKNQICGDASRLSLYKKCMPQERCENPRYDLLGLIS